MLMRSSSGGVPPYFLAIVPGGQVSASPLQSFPQTSATSQTWLVNIAAGTSITLLIRDSTGQTAFSGIITIQAGTDSSCVGQNSQSSSSGSATGASSSASASATSVAGATSSSAASSASASTSAAASLTTKASSSASGSSAAASTTNGSSASSAPASASTSAKPNGAIRFDSGPASGIVSILLAALLV